MVERILEFIVTNKEWIFSGVGVVTISAIATCIYRQLTTKTKQGDNNSIVYNDNRPLTLESCFLLVYTFKDNDVIMKARSFNGRIIVSTRKRSFMKDLSSRESAIWQDAVDTLIENGLIRCVKRGDNYEIYELTGAGFKKGEELDYSMGIDTTKNPREGLNKEWF